jgi:type I restriction enzyme S subunit
MIQYGLEENEISAIKNILAQHEEVEQAILYGSRAKGNFKPASDIDLVLKGEKLNITIQNKIANELDDLLLPYIFDLSVFHQISNVDLLEHIERVGVTFYELEFNDWKRVKLGLVCEKIGSGATPRGGKETYSEDGEYALIRSQNVLDFFFSMQGLAYIDEGQARQLKNVEVKEDDVLLNITGDSVARVCQVPRSILPARVNQHVAIIRPNAESLSASFLKYSLLTTSYKSRLLSLASVGATRNALTKGMIEDLVIRLPGIKTQKRIASILSSLDDKIELNRQTNRTLEEIAKTLFQETCVLKGDELPEGWRSGRLADFVYVNPKLPIRKDSQAKYVEMKDLSEILSSIKSCVPREFSSGSKFQNGDVLMARITPCLENGKTGIVNFLTDGEVGWGSTEFLVLRGKGAIDTSFVYCLARSNSFREFAIKSMVGSSGRQRVAEPTLLQYQLAVPPDDVLESFSYITEGLFRKVYFNHNQNLSLIALRDSLLPKLMNGDTLLDKLY